MLLLLASEVLAIHFSVIDGKLDCPKINNGMLCARSIEKSLIKKHSFIQRMTDKSLRVVLPTGGEKQFNDVRFPMHYDEQFDVNEVIVFSAIEYIAEYGYLILARHYLEDSGYSLLHLATGAVRTLPGYPLFSPDGRYVVVAERDLMAGYVPNTLQIYRVTGSFTLVYDARPTGWGPDNVSWLNATTVIFEKTTVPDTYFSDDEALRGRYRKEPATLQKIGAKWVLTLK